MDLGERWRGPNDNFTAHPKLDAKTGACTARRQAWAWAWARVCVWVQVQVPV